MKTNIMRTSITTILALGLFAILSCGQDPIFWYISKETPPLEPYIEGTPTNMVIFKRGGEKILVVANMSSRIYWYRNGSWNSGEYSIPGPGGKIFALATTNDGEYLYALTLIGDTDARLMQIGNTGNWRTVSAGKYQSLYADPEEDRVFVGVRHTDSNQYDILYLDDPSASSLKLLKSDTGLLSGAAFDGNTGNHCLSTRGKGIFWVAETTLAGNAPVVTSSDSTHTFMGMIKLKDSPTNPTIVAVDRDGGAFYKVNNTVEQLSIATGNYALTALALWADKTDPDTPLLLIASIQGTLYYEYSSSYTNGYVEFPLDETNGSITGARNKDPSSFRSVNDRDRYRSTLGIKAINHLFQAPFEVDENMTFFASTHNAGLWSYRDRSEGGWQWNAETD